MEKLNINIENTTKLFINSINYKKIYSRDEILQIINKCIPFKESSVILSAMIADNILQRYSMGRKSYFIISNNPITKNHIINWINTFRKYKRDRSAKVVNKNQVIKYLNKLSPEEFIDIINPLCDNKRCKLFIPKKLN